MATKAASFLGYTKKTTLKTVIKTRIRRSHFQNLMNLPKDTRNNYYVYFLINSQSKAKNFRKSLNDLGKCEILTR